MVFSGMKKWEMYMILAVSAAVGIWGILDRFIRMPFWIGFVACVLLFTVMCLWRPAAFFIIYPQLKKYGECTRAVVTEYRRVQWGTVGSGVAEVIRYTDKSGRKCEKLLHTMPMLSRKVGRTYVLYYNAEKENEFFVSPQCFFAAAMWVILWALAELPAVIMLLLYNGG